MKIGLYFGSFNPLHNGHLAIANYAVEQTDLNEVWFVVSPHNPLKERNILLSDLQRLEMVKSALTEFSKLKVSDIEFSMPRPSYTIDTISKLNELFPKYEFVIIMGSDGLVDFEKWKDFKTLIDKYKRYIYPRPNTFDFIKNASNSLLMNAPMMEISSTEIRNKIANNEDIFDLIPNSVLKIILENGYYK